MEGAMGELEEVWGGAFVGRRGKGFSNKKTAVFLKSERFGANKNESQFPLK